MDINNQIRHLNLRESKRKLVSLEIARRKRTEINDLINKELRIKNGAQNLLNVCNNSQSEQRLKLELTFVDSKIKYLKDQLAELNCDWTLFKMKNTDHKTLQTTNSSNKVIKQSAFISPITSSVSSFESPTNSGSCFTPSHLVKPEHDSSVKPFDPLSGQSLWPNTETSSIELVATTTYSNTDSFSPSSSSSSALTITPAETPMPSKSKNGRGTSHEASPKDLMRSISSNRVVLIDQASNQEKSTDLMIYLSLKETNNNLDYGVGFKNFLMSHYREEPCNYMEQIRQLNNYRESIIKLSYEPSPTSIQRLFEYFNSLQLIERRFFRNSQCNHVFFTWYDSINGVESTQKSIQFEKASILFNCATLYTQLAAICCDGKDQKQQDQMVYWLKAAGCLKFLTKNFSNSPSFDMSSILLNFFIETFICQAYEVKAKIIILNLSNRTKYDPNATFIGYLTCARIYSHISERYSTILIKLETNTCIKNYLPEIWYYLIKVKLTYYKGLAHYYSALGLTINGLESLHDSPEARALLLDMHDHKPVSSYFMKNSGSVRINAKSFVKKMTDDHELVYGVKTLRNGNNRNLARIHMRESMMCQEEAIRQHSFCRKFSTDDYLHNLLQFYHENSLEKLRILEAENSNDFDDEMFDLLPMNVELSESMGLQMVEPNFHQYESKEFFNLIGPLKIYSSEIELSVPHTYMLKKYPYQQTFGITVKGDCPVRINHVDPQSYAYNIGIREGSYIIEIQDHDVRWLKHNQIVERIRSYPHSVKLTLVNITEFQVFCEPSPETFNTSMENELESIKPKNVESSSVNKTAKNKYTTYLTSNDTYNNELNSFISKKFAKTEQSTPATSIRNRLFKNTRHTQVIKTPVLSAPSANNQSNIALDAANKLYNLAKTTGSTVNLTKLEPSMKTSKSDRYKLSINNMNQTAPIRFNIEDDEISDKENLLFWQNIKSLKTPFTNTITLGRKFKRNVLKLSIFNSFAGSNSDLSGDKSTQKSDVGIEYSSILDNKSNHLSCSKNKHLKKKKKQSRETEKNNMDIFKKMAAAKDNLNDDHTVSSDRLQSKSSIYKTL